MDDAPTTHEKPAGNKGETQWNQKRTHERASWTTPQQQPWDVDELCKIYWQRCVVAERTWIFELELYKKYCNSIIQIIRDKHAVNRIREFLCRFYVRWLNYLISHHISMTNICTISYPFKQQKKTHTHQFNRPPFVRTFSIIIYFHTRAAPAWTISPKQTNVRNQTELQQPHKKTRQGSKLYFIMLYIPHLHRATSQLLHHNNNHHICARCNDDGASMRVTALLKGKR